MKSSTNQEKGNTLMEIERISTYQDKRFPDEILLQHGAFVVNGSELCMFKIIDHCSAEVQYDVDTEILPVIDNFREYAEHITNFYDKNGHKIAEFKPVSVNFLPLESIQPSQFYVDSDKVEAVSSFLHDSDDIIIPVTYDVSIKKYISLDGHSRMYYAAMQGWENVKAFEATPGSYIFEFAKEARRRGIFSPKQIIKLSHQEYIQKWYQFCDDYFRDK